MMEERLKQLVSDDATDKNSPKRTVNLRKLSIVVKAKNHNPTILNPDFLKSNQIVPLHWELKENPICVDPHAEVSFKNGIKIIAEFETITFAELLNLEKGLSPCVPEIAGKYVNTLPHVDYTGYGMDIHGDTGMSEADIEDFVTHKLIRVGPWSQLQGQPAKIGLRLHYQLNDGYFNLTVIPTIRQEDEGESLPVIFWGATIHHRAEEKDSKGRLKQVLNFINQWKIDVDMYLKQINENFLREA